MRRAIPVVSLVTFVSLSMPARPSLAQAPPAASEKERKDKPQKQQVKEKKSPRVFTNDDLEATSERPSAVQNATAQGAAPPPPPRESSTTPEESSPQPTPMSPAHLIDEQDTRIKDAEENVKALDQAANALLWQYLQSTDTYEILRLKSEQQEILTQLEQARAELARLKGEATGVPTATPTPPPG